MNALLIHINISILITIFFSFDSDINNVFFSFLIPNEAVVFYNYFVF